MIISYTEKDIERILREYHSYGKNPIKVGYTTQEIESIWIQFGQVHIQIKGDDDEPKEIDDES